MIILLPNAMARATGDPGESNIARSLANRNTIIACLDKTPSYFHIHRFAYVDAIGVGGVCRGCDSNSSYQNAFAVGYMHVESHAVHE